MNTLQTQRDNTAFLLTDVIPWMLPNPSDDYLEFGIGSDKWDQFFGGKESGPLQERIPRIQAHLDDLNLRIATE